MTRRPENSMHNLTCNELDVDDSLTKYKQGFATDVNWSCFVHRLNWVLQHCI